MSKNKIEITLISPICIAQKRGSGNEIKTMDYIPGSTIRGAIAMLYLRQNGKYDQNKRRWNLDEEGKAKFDAIFNSDEMRFGNCYYDGGKVVPYTATSCKYFKGFSGNDENHGVLDTLMPLAEYELLGKGQARKIEKKFEKCEECESVMDRFGGYYSWTDETTFKHKEVNKRLITHTAVMDSLETAQPNYLYTMEVLNEGQEFAGILEADDDTLTALEGIISGQSIRIGSAKSRGLGEVKLELHLKKNVSNWPYGKFAKNDLVARFDKMNSEMRQYISEQDLQQESKVDDLCFFSVTLHSDAIMRDEILRFNSILGVEDLVELLPNISKDQEDILRRFTLLRAWTSTLVVSGWNEALKLPKEDEIAISKGSVFLFANASDNSLTEDEQQALADMLKEIETSGIGKRKNEGFGDIRICDEFHCEVPYK